MKTVMHTSFLEEKFGIEKAIDLIADAGFDGLDYSDFMSEQSLSKRDDYIEKAKAIREKAESRGLKFCQTHGPMVTGLLKKYPLEYVQSCTVRSIEVASLLGAEAVVIHPIQDPLHKLGDESVFNRNMEFFKYFIPYCEKYNVKIAIENMCKTDPKSGVVHDGVCAHPLEYIRYIDELNSPYATACFDTGHCAATGREPHDVIRIVGGKRITCLHLHDNNYRADQHMLPFTMDMDWIEICKALAEVDYKGHITMEASNYTKKFPDEFIPVALKFKADIARFIADTVEKYKG